MSNMYQTDLSRHLASLRISAAVSVGGAVRHTPGHPGRAQQAGSQCCPGAAAKIGSATQLPGAGLFDKAAGDPEVPADDLG